VLVFCGIYILAEFIGSFLEFFSKGPSLGELLFLGNSKGPPIDLVFPKVFIFHEFVLRNFEIM